MIGKCTGFAATDPIARSRHFLTPSAPTTLATDHKEGLRHLIQWSDSLETWAVAKNQNVEAEAATSATTRNSGNQFHNMSQFDQFLSKMPDVYTECTTEVSRLVTLFRPASPRITSAAISHNATYQVVR
nr:uncharacterized protein CTRU02_11645 [Colletotrichum truncatum]KAF6785660.1 hypothetical protein CTRU02_11645 [Colletotrichum truncatum]